MEYYVDSARELVATYRNNGLGKMESAYVIQYAFYADSFDKVIDLSRELAKRGYEAEHGMMDSEFLQPYDLEMDQKIKKIREFTTLSEQVAQILDEGNRLFEKMQELFDQVGLGKSYGDFLYEREEERRRIKREEEEREKRKVADNRRNGHCLR